MAFGGPDSPEAIEPFLINLMGGRKPAPPILEKVKARYDLIGGFSPLPKITSSQASLLQAQLQEFGDIEVKVGMANSHPSIKDSIKAFVDEGYNKVVAVSLSPHYSRVSTGAYKKQANEAIEELRSDGSNVEVIFGNGWYNHPLYVEAVTDMIEEKLGGVAKDEIYLIFSAHSLPISHIEEGDSYVKELTTSVSAIVEKVKPLHWALAYQSKSHGQGEWLGPEVEEVLNKLPAEGFKKVLVVPMSFASDHIETLYDIDICQKKHAQELGLDFYRIPALNTSPKFIAALAEIVKEKLDN